jgi:very-short-patch-repair endonuclease
MRPTTKAVVEKARALRRRMSPPEVILWQHLRGSPDGYKFRRQHPVARNVADFDCPAAKLVIELDGDAHDFQAQAEHDEGRDAELLERGYRTLRIPAARVYDDVGEVVSGILASCRS